MTGGRTTFRRDGVGHLWFSKALVFALVAALGLSYLSLVHPSEAFTSGTKLRLAFSSSSPLDASPSSISPSDGSMKKAAFKYEVTGKVQGVFFRKYTQKKAKELGLVGWVMNTERGTVVGEAEGDSSKLRELETWLRTTGSPKSRIDKLDISDRREVSALSYQSFDVRGA